MKLNNLKALKNNSEKAAKLLRALSNPERLLILCHLIEGERCVGEMLEKSELSQSAFSQHLGVLRRDGLVKTRKEMQTVYYSLANQDAILILETLHKLYCK